MHLANLHKGAHGLRERLLRCADNLYCRHREEITMPRHGENIFKRKDGRREARYAKEIALDGTKSMVQSMREHTDRSRLSSRCPSTSRKLVLANWF